jgi:hypothetical protein
MEVLQRDQLHPSAIFLLESLQNKNMCLTFDTFGIDQSKLIRYLKPGFNFDCEQASLQYSSEHPRSFQQDVLYCIQPNNERNNEVDTKTKGCAPLDEASFWNVLYMMRKVKIYILQHSYERWVQHKKDNFAGKRGLMMDSVYGTIVRGVILDDVANSWDPRTTMRFVLVNPVLAATDSTYLSRICKPYSIYWHPMFWMYVCLLSVFFFSLMYSHYLKIVCLIGAWIYVNK